VLEGPGGPSPFSGGQTTVMLMTDIEVVIFDCDGVMFDSTHANTAYYNHILEHFGRPEMTPEQFTYTHMHTVNGALAFLFEDRDQYQSAQVYRRKVGYAPFIKDMVMMPHLRPFIEGLRSRYRTAIATNRSDTMQRVLMEHDLEGHFDLVVTAMDVGAPKPDPEQLIKVLSHFDIGPSQALYIGDSALDEIAARSARVAFVAYCNPELAADMHISDFRDLEAILIHGDENDPLKGV